MKQFDQPVTCEGCNSSFARRDYDWFTHFCGVLTDHNGQLVRIGSVMVHIDAPKRVYVVTEMQNTFTKSRYCVGERRSAKGKLDGNHYVLRPRLMVHHQE